MNYQASKWISIHLVSLKPLLQKKTIATVRFHSAAYDLKSMAIPKSFRESLHTHSPHSEASQSDPHPLKKT